MPGGEGAHTGEEEGRRRFRNEQDVAERAEDEPRQNDLAECRPERAGCERGENKGERGERLEDALRRHVPRVFGV